MNIIANSLKLEQVEAVVWDKDGTIIDAHKYWGEIIKRRAKKIIEQYQISDDLYKSICLIMGLDLNTEKLIKEGPIAILSREEVLNKLNEGLIKLNIPSNKELNNEIFKEVHKNFENCAINYVELLPHVKNIIKNFSLKGVRQILITSDTKENAIICLKKFDLYKYFYKIYGKNDFDMPKKTGIPLIKVMEINNLNKNETICIGDAKMDYDMAYNAKVKAVVLVATGQTELSQLLEYSKYSIENLGNITIE